MLKKTNNNKTRKSNNKKHLPKIIIDNTYISCIKINIFSNKLGISRSVNRNYNDLIYI